MKQKKEAIDIGTSELSHHFTIVPKLTRGSYGLNGRVMDETEIDRLLLEERINPNEHSTLEAFLNKLHRVGFVGLKSPSYDSPIHADPSVIGDKRANSVLGITKLIKKLDASIGRTRRMALVNLVVMDLRWEESDEILRECVGKLMEAM